MQRARSILTENPAHPRGGGPTSWGDDRVGEGGAVDRGPSGLAAVEPAPFRARYPETRLHIIEGFYPTLESGLRDGSIDFYIGPDSGAKTVAELSRELLFNNRRIVLCRRGHPLHKSTSLVQLQSADWITTSITADAEDEIGIIFRRHDIPSPRLAVRSQSALTLLTCLANTDLLAMVPQQWADFDITRDVLWTIKIEEELIAPPLVLIQRADLPLTPASIFLLDLIRRACARMADENSRTIREKPG